MEQITGSDGQVYLLDRSAPRSTDGASTVYNAQTIDGILLVLKVVKIRSDSTARWYADSRLAEREFQVAKHLQPSADSHLMPIIDSFEIDDGLAILMPRADYSLRELIRDRGPLPESDARQLLLDVLAGMRELADKGVVHRDIKPGNILWWHDRWVLTDFDIARVLSEPTGTYTWAGTGTHYYWAPELFAFETASVRSDLYALGCTIFEALTAEKAFDGPNLREAHTNEHVDLPQLSDGAFLRVLSALLSKDKANRPVDARRAEEMLVPSKNLDAGQQALQRLGQRFDMRQRDRELNAAASARRRQRQQIARAEFEEFWSTLAEKASRIDFDCSASNQGNNWFLQAFDGRLSAEMVFPSDEDQALCIGVLVVRHLDRQQPSTVGNLLGESTGDGIRWKFFEFARNALAVEHLPLGRRLGSQFSGMELDSFVQFLAAVGRKGAPPAFPREKAMTTETLLEVFASEVIALDEQPGT